MSQGDQPKRQRTLTDADMSALAGLLRKQQQEHVCRFDNITPEDMDFIKDLLSIYKETRSEVLKWIVKGLVYVTLAAFIIFAYLKVNGKSP